MQDDGSLVSIFEFDGSSPNKRNALPLAKNALKKLRTTRHPDVLKFIDAVETDPVIYLVTERVKPLSKALPAWSNKTDKERQEWLVWGLHRVSVRGMLRTRPCSPEPGRSRFHQRFGSIHARCGACGFNLDITVRGMEVGRLRGTQ